MAGFPNSHSTQVIVVGTNGAKVDAATHVTPVTQECKALPNTSDKLQPSSKGLGARCSNKRVAHVLGGIYSGLPADLNHLAQHTWQPTVGGMFLILATWLDRTFCRPQRKHHKSQEDAGNRQPVHMRRDAQK